jgi:hypothetical protein
VVAAVGLVVYFVGVGLDKADKLASVVGAFIGLAGLGLAGYGTVLARRSTPQPEADPQLTPDQEPASGTGSVHNTFSGGTAYGPVIMGRDITGSISSGPTPAPSQPPPPPSPSPSPEESAGPSLEG